MNGIRPQRNDDTPTGVGLCHAVANRSYFADGRSTIPTSALASYAVKREIYHWRSEYFEGYRESLSRSLPARNAHQRRTSRNHRDHDGVKPAGRASRAARLRLRGDK